MTEGIIKTLDSQNRLLIPKVILNHIGAEKGDTLEIYASRGDDDLPTLILRKAQPRCVVCSQLTERLIDEGELILGKTFCKPCLKYLAKKEKEKEEETKRAEDWI